MISEEVENAIVIWGWVSYGSYSHPLPAGVITAHTCATQLLNVGCKVTSIQRFLGHKWLNSTMIYARAHDKSVAEDYFRETEQVEPKAKSK